MRVALSLHVLKEEEYVVHSGDIPKGIDDGSYEGYRPFKFYTIEAEEEDIEIKMQDVISDLIDYGTYPYCGEHVDNIKLEKAEEDLECNVCGAISEKVVRIDADEKTFYLCTHCMETKLK